MKTIDKASNVLSIAELVLVYSYEVIKWGMTAESTTEVGFHILKS